MPRDISNIRLGNLISIEFIIAVAGFVFSAALVWGSLNEQVQANSKNDEAIMKTQARFAVSIEQIKVSQEVSRTEITNFKRQLKEQTDNSNYVKRQVDDIKRILMEIKRD